MSCFGDHLTQGNTRERLWQAASGGDSRIFEGSKSGVTMHFLGCKCLGVSFIRELRNILDDRPSYNMNISLLSPPLPSTVMGTIEIRCEFTLCPLILLLNKNGNDKRYQIRDPKLLKTVQLKSLYILQLITNSR